MNVDVAREQAMSAAEPMFCSRGVGAVRMEDVRDASGVSLRRLYGLFSSKETLAIECLRARDVTQHDRLREHLRDVEDPVARLLGVFGFFEVWFQDPDFAGCAWINSYGELGASSPRIAAAVRDAKDAFRRMLGSMVADAGLPAGVADSLMVLAEGAIVCATIQGRPTPAEHARIAADALIASHAP